MTRIHLNAPFGHELPRELLERAALLTLRGEGVEEAEMSFTFLPDAEIRDLNARWLRHDRVTDVISFALYEPGEAPVGDVYVGIEEASRQAAEHGVPLVEELARLVAHGTLHVLGYEHPEPAETSPMIRKQEAVVKRLAFGTDPDA